MGMVFVESDRVPILKGDAIGFRQVHTPI